MPTTKTPNEILELLRAVKYPGYTRDIVSFGMVRDVQVGSDAITIVLSVTSRNPETVEQIRRDVERVVGEATGSPVRTVLAEPAGARPAPARGPRKISGAEHVVAVASGKGGVGKSTVAVNLALALRQLGHSTGLLDADVYGPSVPLLLGLGDRPVPREDNRIEPVERYGLRVMSMGLLVGRATPIIWRGPMVNKLLTQFLHDVDWGKLDFLVLDLPPGTGDAQLTVAQQVALSGGIIVTTPQDVALADVKRGIKMFEQVHAPVLGLVENMSYYECRSCGHRAEIFGHGGGRQLAEKFGIPFLAEIPISRELREASDRGEPIVATRPDHPVSRIFAEIARRVVEELRARQEAEVLPTVH
ncbi:MAG: iron-sulfur cluster carrier protein [Candidatus Binatia bacterium]|nr:MAG: iron-sulfur cluster carrier protein [Candidatus Binatia bacterium]